MHLLHHTPQAQQACCRLCRFGRVVRSIHYPCLLLVRDMDHASKILLPGLIIAPRIWVEMEGAVVERLDGQVLLRSAGVSCFYNEDDIP
jgi:hypothetical protein